MQSTRAKNSPRSGASNSGAPAAMPGPRLPQPARPAPASNTADFSESQDDPAQAEELERQQDA